MVAAQYGHPALPAHVADARRGIAVDMDCLFIGQVKVRLERRSYLRHCIKHGYRPQAPPVESAEVKAAFDAGTLYISIHFVA